MRYVIPLLAVLFAVVCSSAQDKPPLTTVAEVSQVVASSHASWEQHLGRRFEVTGAILSFEPGSGILLVTDDKDGLVVFAAQATKDPSNAPLAAGDIVSVSGQIRLSSSNRLPMPFASSVRFLRHGPPPQAHPASGADFERGAHDYSRVKVRGQVLDVVTDEIDQRIAFILLDCDGVRIPCPIDNDKGLHELINRSLEVEGLCVPDLTSSRKLLGRALQVQKLKLLDDRAPDLFAVPELTGYRFRQAKEIASLGRRRLTGRTVAVWGRSALIMTPDVNIARIDLMSDDLPQRGDTIEASGIPETDTYIPILRRAIWRKTDAGHAEPDESPLDVPFISIFLKENNYRINSLLHGKVIRTSAMVLGLPSANGPDQRMTIGTDEWSIPVDISSAVPHPRGLSIGSTVEITGLFLLKCQPWRPNAPLPPIDSAYIITRSPADIRILSTPSWTVGQLLVVVGILGVGLVLILIWNWTLHRLAEQRGRTLSEERIARAEAEIKTLERTRLAVELHDTIAQNLTGVSIALDTARQFCSGERTELQQQIDVADATLDSCQLELRNCLWDLRNQALEEPDFNVAIRTALQPHVNGAEVEIRFNAPRERMTENTAHTILRIIRELVINAVRHGHATRIRIAGAIDPDALRFSVKDNGCGFDTASCPGIDQRHFGLQGIRERLSLIGGGLLIESRQGRGTKATISIPLPDRQALGKQNEKN